MSLHEVASKGGQRSGTHAGQAEQAANSDKLARKAMACGNHTQRPLNPAPAHAPALQLVQAKSLGLSSVEPGMHAVQVLAPWARLVSRPAGQRMHVLAA